MDTFGDARLPDRFWQKIEVSDLGCWVWTATRTYGYGKFRLSNPRRLANAHRIAYEALVGPIPEGLDLNHLCRNRACCKPAHLEPVPRRLAELRGDTLPGANLKVTNCPAGHPYDTENLIVRTRGEYTSRECRACRRQADRARAPRPSYYKPRERTPDTTCREGHEFTVENTLIRKNGRRRCRTCDSAYQRERRARATSRPE